MALTESDLKEAIGYYESVLGVEKRYGFNDRAELDCAGGEIGVKPWGREAGAPGG